VGLRVKVVAVTTNVSNQQGEETWRR
jgi:hypothetical protein